jgi:hypothetical protein
VAPPPKSRRQLLHYIIGKREQKLIIPNAMFRRVDIPESLSNAGFGKLYLSAMPGRYSPLEGFIGELEREDVKWILCLVHNEEIAKKSPRYRAALDGKQIPAVVVQFPIRDFGVPDDPQASSGQDRVRTLENSRSS